MKSYSEWILCPSKSFPGNLYYFNVRNGKAAWDPGHADIRAGRPPETSRQMENHNHLERNSPPAPDLLQHYFFVPQRQTPGPRPEVTPFSSIQQTPGPRPEVTPFSSIRQTPGPRPEVTPFSSIRQTPETRHEVTPFSSIHLGLLDSIRQNYSSFSSMCHTTPVFGQITFPRVLPKYEDSKVTWTPIQIQVHIPLQNQTSTALGAEYPAFRDHPNISNADGSQVPQSMEGFKYITQGLDNIECKEILVDASNIPLHQRFINFEAPGICFSKVNEDKALENLRLANKPRSFESKSSHNFADFKTNSSDFIPKTGNSVMKEPVLNFGLFSNTTIQDLNVGLSTKIQQQRNQNFNVGSITTTDQPLPVCNQETSLNFEPLRKTKEPYVNFGSSNEPVFNGQASKAKDLALNGLPSKTPETNKEPKSVIKGCVKSLKSCLKGNKGDNAVAKSFDDDLRAILISKRKSQDFSKADGSKPKRSKQETPVKKKVSFNLDHETIYIVSSLEDDEDVFCGAAGEGPPATQESAFIELYKPTLCYLKALGQASSQDTWCILADTEVLTKEIEFIDAFVQIDPTCKLLIPSAVHSWLLALARGCDRPLATAATNVLRRTTSSHVVVQPCNEQDNSTCIDEALICCCVEIMHQNKHLVFISDDLELLSAAKCYSIHCYSMNSIKNGIPATKPLQYKTDMKITIRNDTQNIKNDSVIEKSTHHVDLNEKEKAIIRNFQISNYPIGQNPNLKEKKQNENPNEKFQNGQTGTGPNAKNLIKHFYRDESIRIADAIELYHTDSENITASVNTGGIHNETHDVSNISTIQNESMDFEKSFQSIEIDKSIENKENSNKVTKTAETRWRFESEIAKTSLEDDIQKCNIKDTKLLNTDPTVSVFFKNQKPVDLQNFKFSPKLKISLQNNKIPDILEENNNQREKENQERHFKNRDPRLEMRKSTDSIFEICKEKSKEPPTTEFEYGKTNMASHNQKILYEFESGKPYMASQYNRTKLEDQNGKTNTSSQLDRSKSHMASTSNGFDVSKPQTMMNRIDYNRFHVKSKDMEQRLNARMDEWVCFYTQVMEDSLTSVLQSHSPSALALPPPWSLLDALRCVDAAHIEQATVRKIVSHLCSCLYDSRYKMKKFIHPKEFMEALGCGVKLLECLEIILPSIDIQDGVPALQALLTQIEDDTDPAAGFSEPLVAAPMNSETDELHVRKYFVKDKSEITDYLKKYFTDWKDYDPNQDIEVLTARGTLENITKVSDRKNEETIHRNGRNNAGNVATNRNVS